MLPIPHHLEVELLAAPPSSARMAMDDATVDEHSNRIRNNVENALNDERCYINNKIDTSLPSIAPTKD